MAGLCPLTLCCVRGNAPTAKNINGSTIEDFLTVYCCGNNKWNFIEKNYTKNNKK